MLVPEGVGHGTGDVRSLVLVLLACTLAELATCGNMRLRALHARPGSHSSTAVTDQLSHSAVTAGSTAVQRTHRELAPGGVQRLEPAKQLRLLQASKRGSNHGTMACVGSRRFRPNTDEQHKRIWASVDAKVHASSEQGSHQGGPCKEVGRAAVAPGPRSASATGTCGGGC